MNEEEKKEAKSRVVASLKEDVKETINDDFVERYEFWKEKMNSVNNLLNSAFPGNEVYSTFDEFCKIIIDITSRFLDSDKMDYEKLFITKEEYDDSYKESKGDSDILKNLLSAKVKQKFHNNFMINLNSEHFKESVKHKLKEEDYELIKEELDLSLKIAYELFTKN
jgi:hypothetical protein